MKSKNDVDYRWSTVARWGVAVAVYLGGCIFVVDALPNGTDDSWPCAAVFVVAFVAFWLLKFKARREQQRRIDAAALQQSIGR
jgi:hypothetical protein